MKEKIILAPGANGTELTKSMAMHGVNCFNIRICGASELARLLLMRSGIPIREDFVSASGIGQSRSCVSASFKTSETVLRKQLILLAIPVLLNSDYVV